jgi:hypothetical protein
MFGLAVVVVVVGAVVVDVFFKSAAYLHGSPVFVRRLLSTNGLLHRTGTAADIVALYFAIHSAGRSSSYFIASDATGAPPERPGESARSAVTLDDHNDKSRSPSGAGGRVQLATQKSIRNNVCQQRKDTNEGNAIEHNSGPVKGAPAKARAAAQQDRNQERRAPAATGTDDQQ